MQQFDIRRLKQYLWVSHVLAEQRCLLKACEWAEDLFFALPEKNEEELMMRLENQHADYQFNPQYEHSKACFMLHEYDRAADKVRNHEFNNKSRFLHYFSLYKAAEKKRIDLMNEVTVNMPKKAMLKFIELRDSLERSMDKEEPDGWLMYVYALVLQKFRLQRRALEVLTQSLELEPLNLSAWYLLATLIDDKKLTISICLPFHPYRMLFYYMVKSAYDQRGGDLLDSDKLFVEKHLKNSLFIKTLIAKDLSQTSERKDAITIFNQIRQEDPYHVDGMEIFSNALYVLKKKKELAKLAYDMERVDPFTSEANSCIANSYSARDQHTKAIVYFTRALRLNPDNSNSWTLIGHEYLEVKSIEKALQAYRYAIFINKTDHRAWLGLGNTFETIMSNANVANPNYEPCLYYYSQVAKYKPNDQNMFLAMGSIYEKMDRTDLAIICMKRAGKDGASVLERLYESSSRQDVSDETQATDLHISLS